LQSAQHWGVIADHLSGQIIEQAKLGNKSLYIDERRFKSDFSKVFSKQLISELVEKNATINLSTSPESLELEVEMDIIRHPNDRDSGTYFPHTAGLANAWLIVETGAYGLIPTVVAADYLNSLPSRTNTELAITARVMDGTIIQFSETNIYYITDRSITQFNEGRESSSVKLTDVDVPGE
jgi:hypothetical protein